MTNPEFIQSAGTAINQVKEVFDATAKTNLLQTLTDLGHPYGLLLGQSSHLNPVESSLNVSFPDKKTEAIVNSKTSNSFEEGYLGDKTASKSCTVISLPSGVISGIFLVASEAIANSKSSLNLPFLGLSLTNSSVVGNAVFSSTEKDTEYQNLNLGGRLSRRSRFTLDLLSDRDQGDYKASSAALAITSASKAGIKAGIDKNENFARKIHMEELFGVQAVLAPGILKSLTEIGERPRDLRVSRNHIGLGSSSIHLETYNGEAPYLIKSPAGEPLAQINPGDPIASVHVSDQAKLLRNLSPLEKVEQITGDFIDLLKAIDHGGSPDLNEAQQKAVVRASQATIIGISHLVRLFGRKTGLPTWKLDVLPELVQKFHQHDSQVVSKVFGGTRKVRINDVEMMVVTPTMRQQLVAAF